MNIEPSKLKKRFEDFKIFSISKRPVSNSKLTIYQQSTKIFGTGSEKNLARPEENQIKKENYETKSNHRGLRIGRWANGVRTSITSGHRL